MAKIEFKRTSLYSQFCFHIIDGKNNVINEILKNLHALACYTWIGTVIK